MSGVCAASDIWSVGCTVIELLTCVPPYYDLQPMPALFRIVQVCPSVFIDYCRWFIRMREPSALILVDPMEFSLRIWFHCTSGLDSSSYSSVLLFAGRRNGYIIMLYWLLSLSAENCTTFCLHFSFLVVFCSWNVQLFYYMLYTLASNSHSFSLHLSFRMSILLYLTVYLLTLLIFCVNALRRWGGSLLIW